MRETSKGHGDRERRGHYGKYLSGEGLELNSENDPLMAPTARVRRWTDGDGDPQMLVPVRSGTFDFVYASHVLEHLSDVGTALANWARVLRLGGYLYLVIPDWDLYEHAEWPSRFNRDHKQTFSLSVTRHDVGGRPSHFHVDLDLRPLLQRSGVSIVEAYLDDSGYDRSLPAHVDQTLNTATAHVVVIGRRVDRGEIPALTVSHSGDAGDIIYGLPAIRFLSQCHGAPVDLVVFPESGRRVRQTPQTAEPLLRLLRLQPYIANARFAGRPEGFNLDRFRTCRGGNLAEQHILAVGAPPDAIARPWLVTPPPQRLFPVIIHRSSRYHGSNFPWRRIVEKYDGHIGMVGLPEEHAEFCRQFNVKVPFVATADVAELAAVIAGANLFVGNQSLPYAIAEGLGLRSVQEVYLAAPNCIFERPMATFVRNGDAELPDIEGSSVHPNARCSRDVPHSSLGARPMNHAAVDFVGIFEAVGHRTIVSRDRCEMLYRLSRYASALAGDIAEVGVYRGGTSLLLAAANPGKVVHAFDTFCGIPNADESVSDVHANGDFGDLDAEQTIAGLRAAGIRVHRGLFPQTAEGLEGPYCFAHFDGDTYKSCKDFLDYFWPRTVNGGILVFDDCRWHKCPGVEKAIMEHCTAYGSWPFHTANHQVALTVCRAD